MDNSGRPTSLSRRSLVTAGTGIAVAPAFAGTGKAGDRRLVVGLAGSAVARRLPALSRCRSHLLTIARNPLGGAVAAHVVRAA
jgi:hypothetical protein